MRQGEHVGVAVEGIKRPQRSASSTSVRVRRAASHNLGLEQAKAKARARSSPQDHAVSLLHYATPRLPDFFRVAVGAGGELTTVLLYTSRWFPRVTTFLASQSRKER